ncbi:hypothetical protein EV424DRAFT_1354324 [Suillus variegatus]|nr:hypothetical protein EV424DRAFT_1354324 [Suillus variegatus]
MRRMLDRMCLSAAINALEQIRIANDAPGNPLHWPDRYPSTCGVGKDALAQTYPCAVVRWLNTLRELPDDDTDSTSTNTLTICYDTRSYADLDELNSDSQDNDDQRCCGSVGFHKQAEVAYALWSDGSDFRQKVRCQGKLLKASIYDKEHEVSFYQYMRQHEACLLS